MRYTRSNNYYYKQQTKNSPKVRISKEEYVKEKNRAKKIKEIQNLNIHTAGFGINKEREKKNDKLLRDLKKVFNIIKFATLNDNVDQLKEGIYLHGGELCNFKNLLLFAIENSSKNVIRYLLDEMGIIPPPFALERAVDKEDLDIVKILLANSNIDPRVNDNYSIQKAVDTENFDIFLTLMKWKNDKGERIKIDNSLLETAVSGQKFKMIEFLINLPQINLDQKILYLAADDPEIFKALATNKEARKILEEGYYISSDVFPFTSKMEEKEKKEFVTQHPRGLWEPPWFLKWLPRTSDKNPDEILDQYSEESSIPIPAGSVSFSGDKEKLIQPWVESLWKKK